MKFDLGHLVDLRVRRRATASARFNGAQYGNVTAVRLHDVVQRPAGFVVTVSVTVAGHGERFFEFRSDRGGNDGALWPVARPAAA